jgi:predicted DsbA family dithiol-disulfide isomerase
VSAPGVQVQPGTVVIFSDIGCPWAHAAVWRIWDARRRLGLDDRVRFDHHAFPLELFNSQATPRDELDAEVPTCASLAPRAGWQPWAAPDWTYPATMLPAMEAVQAAKRQGLAVSEALDRGLRRAFWGESRCVSLRHVILEVASEVDELDLSALAEGLDSGRARGAIFDDWAIAKTDAVQGSPHFFLSDGTNAQNPGLQLDWHEGEDGLWRPTIVADDPSAYERLLLRAAAAAA